MTRLLRTCTEMIAFTLTSAFCCKDRRATLSWELENAGRRVKSKAIARRRAALGNGTPEGLLTLSEPSVAG